MRTARTLAVLALLLLLIPSRAAAQNRVAVEVDAGYDGYYSPTAPAPVRIRLTNGGESFRARVELEAPAQGGRVRYYTDLDLPRNSSKVVTLYPNYTGFTTGAQVRVLDGEALIAKGEDKLTRVESNNRLHGVLAPDLGPYAGLASRSDAAESFVALLDAGSVPDRADALLPLASLTVDGAATEELSDAQRKALAAWLELGGKLIIAGGPDAARNAAGLQALMPVATGGQLNAADLSALAGTAAPPPRGGVLTQATPVEGASVAAASPQGPLVVTRPRGRGAVMWLAWSPSAPPFNTWAGNAPLLGGLVASGAPPVATAAQVDGWAVQSFLSNIAGAQLPSTLLVAGFLLIYTLVIGPLLYFILKRRDRRELAWVAVPALTLLFSGVAYGANFLIRGTGTTLRTLEVIDAYPGAAAQHVTTYAGLFSPGRREYDLQLAPGLSMRGPSQEEIDMGMARGPGGNAVGNRGPLFTVEAGERPVLRDVAVDVYSLRTISGQRVETARPSVLEARLNGNNGAVTGEVRNLTGAPIENVYYIDQSGVHSLGAIGPNETRAVTGKEPAIQHQGWEGPGAPADWDRRQVIDGVWNRMMNGGPEGPGGGLDPNEVLLLAWQKADTNPIQVLDARASHISDRLVIVHSTYQLKAGPVKVDLAPQSITHSDDGRQVEMTFRLPEGVTAEKLSLGARDPSMGGGMTEPIFDAEGNVVGEQGVPMAGGPDMLGTAQKVEVADPSGSAWADVTDKAAMASGAISIKDAARYTGKDGSIRLRLTGADGGPVEWFRLTVEGRKR